MAEEIIAQDGALISEQPPGTKPSRRTLVARNRLQIGLADALLVAESGLEGGSMHTVRFAAEQGKVIYCPAPANVREQSAGSPALLERPARELPALLPAWKKAGTLAESLGEKPLARAVSVSQRGVEGWLDEIAAATSEPSRPASGPKQLSFDP
jgi:DNA processing protein